VAATHEQARDDLGFPLEGGWGMGVGPGDPFPDPRKTGSPSVRLGTTGG
jgi:hypothetical protein